jgi:aspartyl-tRNA(Asn)/glutamyl-tRNA(Gln) amidotransferase subunit A
MDTPAKHRSENRFAIAQTVEQAERDLADGKVTSRELTERSFARIRDEAGEGRRTFIRLFEAQALAAAAASDLVRRAGCPPPPLSGVPISIKDLFDVKGTTTLAGSTVLADRAPATRDAVAIARLREAGAVIVGTTNMTEFAMGGLGLNPHYGTPRNPWDRAVGRIPGGSSSGAAISITDGMAVAAIGSDTTGSVRMPAALCGVVGFKPTARRVPLDGAIPLAPSLDSIGVLASTVECCARIDAVLAREESAAPYEIAVSGLRFAVPTTLVFDGADAHVGAAFSRALSALSRAGCMLVEIEFAELGALPTLSGKCSFQVAEGYAWHHDLLAQKGSQYDPIVAKRFSSGASIGAKEYIDLVEGRKNLIGRSRSTTRGYDAVLMPTVPVIAPRIADVRTEAAYLESNFLIVRNPGLVNLLDRCAISLPCHRDGDAPVGLTMMGETMADRRLLGMARAVESALDAVRHG